MLRTAKDYQESQSQASQPGRQLDLIVLATEAQPVFLRTVLSAGTQAALRNMLTVAAPMAGSLLPARPGMTSSCPHYGVKVSYANDFVRHGHSAMMLMRGTARSKLDTFGTGKRVTTSSLDALGGDKEYIIVGVCTEEDLMAYKIDRSLAVIIANAIEHGAGGEFFIYASSVHIVAGAEEAVARQVMQEYINLAGSISETQKRSIYDSAALFTPSPTDRAKRCRTLASHPSGL